MSNRSPASAAIASNASSRRTCTLLGDAVQRRRLLGLRQRRRAAVHQRHLTRAGRRAAQSERANMAEHVQHARTLCQRRDAIAVRPLVEEPAGLLPASGSTGNRTPPSTTSARRIGAEHQRHAFRQPFLPARRRVIARHHGTQRQQRGQCLDDQRRQPIHPGGIRLQHRDIVVAVDHQPGQTVRLGVHQAMERRVADTLAQLDRLAQARAQPGQVDLRRGVAVQQPRRDQAVRIEHEGAEPRAIVAFETHQPARRHLPIFRLHRDLVGEHPGRTGPQPPPLARVEPQRRPIAQAAARRADSRIARQCAPPADPSSRRCAAASASSRSRSSPRGTVG